MASAAIGGGSRPSGGWASPALLALRFLILVFVNALNCVGYGEPDVTSGWAPLRARARLCALRRPFSLRFISRWLYRPVSAGCALAGASAALRVAAACVLDGLLRVG